MKDSDSNKTEPIQELLATKKQEKPDDAFFKNFSDQVLTRLEEPAPKPTLRERLSENVDPFRVAAALFAVAVGCALIIGLEEGSTIAETEPVPIAQEEQEMMADAPPRTTPPLGQAQGTLAEVGLQIIKAKPQPPRILIKPGSGVYTQKANHKSGLEIKLNSYSNSTNYLERK